MEPGGSADLPAGTVAFLFTDVEGSTRLMERFRDGYFRAIARHDALLREAVGAHNGVVFETIGDAVYAAFADPRDAVRAAAEAQLALEREPWGEVGRLRVRMGLHAGEAERRGSHYFGRALYRCARLMATAHGGQVVLSDQMAALVRDSLPPEVTLRELGVYRLKDFADPERVHQLTHPQLPADFPPLRTLDFRPNNLPVSTTSFVGRRRERQTAVERLMDPGVRLLTLTGPGGTGKTRLSQEVAAATLSAFEHGAVFVPLAAVLDPADVPLAIAQALGLREESRPPMETLIDYLRHKQILLVLDNFEQVLGAAPVAGELIRSCPGAKVLVTSRAVLHVYGEHDLPVPPLALPQRDETPDAESLLRYDAVRLFVERARAARPDFAITDETAPAVFEICRRLDGLPLAIELAAARARILPPPALLARLERRLQLLTGGARDLPARQQTLRGAIDWSYDLLSPDEQALFRRLAVFAGGGTLEALEAVCAAGGGPAGDALDGITSLVDKSLVIHDGGAAGDVAAGDGSYEPRFSMLDTIREYALDRLSGAGEAPAMLAHHALHFLALAEMAEPRLQGPDQRMWLDRLEREHDNFRAALSWAVNGGSDPNGSAGGPDATTALRLAGALWRLWQVHGHFIEGRRWLAAALQVGGDAPAELRARALYGAGALAERQGDYAAARALHEQGLALAREMGDERRIAWALGGVGNQAFEQGEYALARTCHEQALALWRKLGDGPGTSISLNNLGYVALNQGELDLARALLQESLAHCRRLGRSLGTAHALSNLGRVAREQGDLAAAESHLSESLSLCQQLGEQWLMARSLTTLGLVVLQRGRPGEAAELLTRGLALRRQVWDKRGIAHSLEALAGLAHAQECSERAACLASAAAALRESISAPPAPADRAEIEQTVAGIRRKLVESEFAAAWDRGRALDLEEAIAYALGTLEAAAATNAAPA